MEHCLIVAVTVWAGMRDLSRSYGMNTFEAFCDCYEIHFSIVLVVVSTYFTLTLRVLIPLHYLLAEELGDM